MLAVCSQTLQIFFYIFFITQSTEIKRMTMIIACFSPLQNSQTLQDAFHTTSVFPTSQSMNPNSGNLFTLSKYPLTYTLEYVLLINFKLKNLYKTQFICTNFVAIQYIQSFCTPIQFYDCLLPYIHCVVIFNCNRDTIVDA